MKWKQCRTAGVPVSHHVLDLCLADSQSQCVINFRLSLGPPHNHKWSKWNMVLPAICIADRLQEIRKYNEDNGAVCMTKKDFDLELCEKATEMRLFLLKQDVVSHLSRHWIYYKTKKRVRIILWILVLRQGEQMSLWSTESTSLCKKFPVMSARGRRQEGKCSKILIYHQGCCLHCRRWIQLAI